MLDMSRVHTCQNSRQNRLGDMREGQQVDPISRIRTSINKCLEILHYHPCFAFESPNQVVGGADKDCYANVTEKVLCYLTDVTHIHC